MAGYTDKVFRNIALDFGADFVFSEMLSAEGVLRNDKATLKIIPSESCRLQIFGPEADRIAEAAIKLKDVATWIDVNAGCPVKKVVRRGSGSALLNDLPRLQKIVLALKAVVDVPVSVKVRLGWDRNILPEIMAALIEVEPSAIFIHGRTKEQGYSGFADWKPIGDSVQACHEKGIKIFGSGDLFKPERIKEVIELYDLDGVIVARGAVGNPWIFEQAKELLKGNLYESVTGEEKLEYFFNTHLQRLIEEKGETKGISESRKFFMGYSRGTPNSCGLRNAFMRARTMEEVKTIITTYKKAI